MKNRSTKKIARSKTRRGTKVTISTGVTGQIDKLKSVKLPDSEELPDHPIIFKMADGVTRSLGAGSYEFARIDVGVEIPCGHSDKDVHRAYLRASRLIEKYMDKECCKILGE